MPEYQDIGVDSSSQDHLNPSGQDHELETPSESPTPGIPGLEYEDLLDDPLGEALETTDLSVDEAYGVFHDILPITRGDGASKRRAKEQD